MLHAVLTLRGYEVAEARDGATALALAAQSHPDVALVDIGLPDMEGHELARRLRAGSPQHSVKLCAVTGYGESPGPLDAGFDAYLTKPVSPERLERALNKLA